MAKQIITDEQAALKKQARRRLLGAIAFTILVVTLLPLVLDREPPAPTQEADLHIPDKDKAGEFVPKMVLPPSDSTAPAAQATSAPVIAPLLDSRTAANVKPNTPAAKPEVAASPAVAEVKPKAEAKPAVEAKPVVEHKPKPDAKPKTEPKVAAKPAAKPAPSKHHAGYVLQVGAFAKMETAKNLQDKLHKLGYPSYTEKAGEVTRVRIGDYSTQVEAEKIRHKLEIQGYQPNVINLK